MNFITIFIAIYKMEISKGEAKILYNFCKDFMFRHKEIYENTVKCIRYNNLIEKTKRKIDTLNEEVELYYLNEQKYRNRLVNMHLHDKIEGLENQIYALREDITYYHNTICRMNASEDIYMKYLYCESDLRRFEKILST